MAGIFNVVCWCSGRLCKLTFRQPYYRNPLLHLVMPQDFRCLFFPPFKEKKKNIFIFTFNNEIHVLLIFLTKSYLKQKPNN